MRRSVRPNVDWVYDRVFPLADGQVSTDGSQYSAVATITTSAVEILSILIDPGVTLELDKIQFGLTQKFYNFTSSNGSLHFNWKARSEYRFDGASGPMATQSSYVAISPSYSTGVTGSSTTEAVLGGYFPVGTLPKAPIRLVLTGLCLAANGMGGRVKNSSYVRLVGRVIPGVD